MHTHLSIDTPGELRLRHHDDDPEHSEYQGIVTKPLSLLEERPPVAQLVSDVLVLFLRRVGALSGQALTGRLAGVLAVTLGNHDLQTGATQGLQGLHLGVQLATRGPPHAPIVPAAAHGSLRAGVGALLQKQPGSSMAQRRGFSIDLLGGNEDIICVRAEIFRWAWFMSASVNPGSRTKLQ